VLHTKSRMLRVWSSADFKAQEPPTTQIRGEVLRALQVHTNDLVLHTIFSYTR
jgi:hypothetical protein